MKNIKDLRDEQINVYEQLKKGDIGLAQAKQLANVAGRILTSCKVQMDYNKAIGNGDNKIEFLDGAK